LQSFVDILGEGDRAWITFFESSHRNFGEKPMPAREIAKQRAFQTIERIGTAGGELRDAIPALLKRARKRASPSEKRNSSSTRNPTLRDSSAPKWDRVLG
jgi:hypothetical protein